SLAAKGRHTTYTSWSASGTEVAVANEPSRDLTGGPIGRTALGGIRILRARHARPRIGTATQTAAVRVIPQATAMKPSEPTRSTMRVMPSTLPAAYPAAAIA